MIELTSLTDLLGIVFGAGGIASFILYRKANNKAKNAEADKLAAEARLTSAEADKQVIENYERLIERYESYAKGSDEKYDKMKMHYDKLIEALQCQIEENTKKLKEIEAELNTAKKFVCYRTDCAIRQAKPVFVTKLTKREKDETKA